MLRNCEDNANCIADKDRSVARERQQMLPPFHLCKRALSARAEGATAISMATWCLRNAPLQMAASAANGPSRLWPALGQSSWAHDALSPVLVRTVCGTPLDRSGARLRPSPGGSCLHRKMCIDH